MRHQHRYLALARVSPLALYPGALVLALLVARLFVTYPAAVTALALAVGLALVSLWMLPSGAVAFAYLLPNTPISPSLHLEAADVLLIAYVVRLSITKSTQPDVARWSRPEVFLVAFACWMWLTTLLVNNGESVTPQARITLYVLVFVFIASDTASFKRLLVAVPWIAAIEMALALTVLGQVGEPLTGTYGDPQQFGILMLAGLALARHTGRGKLLFSAICALGMVLTLRRGIWAAGTATILILLLPSLSRQRARPVIVAGLIALAGLFAAPVITQSFHLNPESITIRQASYLAALPLIEHNPVIGVGWGLTALQDGSATAIQPYNLWLNIASATGVFGAVLFTAFLLALIKEFVQSRTPLERQALAFLIGFGVLSLSEMTIYAGASGTILFFVAMGAAVAAARLRPMHRSSRVVVQAAPT